MKKKGNVIANILFFFMAMVCVALFMPALTETLTDGVSNLSVNTTNYTVITIILNFFPVFLVIMALIIFILLMRI